MNIHFEQFNNDKHDQAVTEVSKWSSESQSMMSLRPAIFPELPYSILAFSESPQKKVLGHVAITSHEPPHISIVGGYVVNPEHRGEGVGLALLEHLIETAKEAIPDIGRCAAIANEQSVSQFMALGGRIVRINEAKYPNLCGAYVVNLTHVLKGNSGL
jgi:ribosomal protein S18 acetylase RimI-like enzyme